METSQRIINSNNVGRRGVIAVLLYVVDIRPHRLRGMDTYYDQTPRAQRRLDILTHELHYHSPVASNTAAWNIATQLQYAVCICVEL